VSDIYRIFGAELSPYSVKVRSYFRFKDIPHRWIVRNPSVMEEFKRYARLPLIPLVVTPDDEGMQDSTPIIERIETLFPEPTIHPQDPPLAFVSALLEEYADEWGNKHMFHYRWWRDVDQISAAERIASGSLAEGATEADRAAAAASIRERMVPRLSFVGSNELTKEQIEASFMRLVHLLEAHLSERDYVLGSRPAMADLGLFAQLYECHTDPTPGAILDRAAPGIVAWIARMLDLRQVPAAKTGSYESWDRLRATLAPILSTEVAQAFLPWSLANTSALEAGRESFEVELEGELFRQGTQKYHARSLAALRAKYNALEDRSELDDILRDTGCLPAIAG
jgi:glutathione S-transferase